MSSKKHDRIDRIKKMLISQTGISIREFSALLNVSEITIRRDLQELEKQGLIRLVNGVAIYQNLQPVSPYPAYDLEQECLVFQQKKERIGKRAAALIESNDVAAIDNGSTTAYLSKNLPHDVHMTVLTASMNVLADLQSHRNCDIISAGGYYYPNTQMFYSPEGISMINRTCINKAFISAAGISEKMNVTCIAPQEMDTKRALTKNAQTKILMADSSKFGKIFPTAFAHLQDFDIVITDKDLPKAWKGLIEGAGIQLYCE